MNLLRESYPALKQILENIKQVVWVLDLSSEQILYVSPVFELIWGISCENLYADPHILIQCVHPEDRVKVIAASPDDNRKSMTQSYRILRPDGSLRWVSVHTFLIGNETPATALQVFIAQDITDQNQVEQTLHEALERSREQFMLSRRMSLARKPEAVLKTLMSAFELRIAQDAHVLFFESPQAGPNHGINVVTSWSALPTLPTLTHPSSRESTTENSLLEELALLNLFHPAKPVIVTEIASDQRLTPMVRELLLQGQIQTVAIFPLVALGNWLGCLVVFFSQAKDFEPVELRHIKILVDQATITLYNLHLLEIEAESRHEAERANEIKTRFLAMISHELRTPLTSIKGFTTTLLAEDVVWQPEEQNDFLQTIQQETNRLQELIDHLLDLSRLEAGMLPIVLEPHSFPQIVLDLQPQIQRMAQKHSLSIRVPAHLPPILGDTRRIAQILENLVQNAVKYTPDDTEIALTASVRGGWMQVNVIDQGPGIPPAERKRVFQAFRRGRHEEDGTGKGAGAGLGLAICKGLVEAHGGRIWVKQQTSPGTTISFTLPLVSSNTPVYAPGEA